MFINNKHNTMPSSRKFSCTSSSDDSDSTSQYIMTLLDGDSRDLLNNDNFNLKKEFARNLHDLIEFIRVEIDDTSEKQIYFEYIQIAFEYLSSI